MKLKLLAEDRTKQEAIEYLADGIRRIIPVSLDLSFHGERYALKKDGLRIYGCDTDDLASADALTVEDITFYNLKPVAERFATPELDEYLLVLTHSNFVYIKNNKLYAIGWVGRDLQEDFRYSGMNDPDERILVVGGDNLPSDNNVKVACHETVHVIRQDVKRIGAVTWEPHCKNYIGDKRCLMNPPVPTKKRMMEEVYLGLCQSCIDSIKSVGEK